MLNQVVLVGRIVRDPEFVETETNKKMSRITVAIPRSFKNMDGTYDTDFIDCVAFDNIAVNTSDYCNKGDILGVKGRVQSRVVEEGDTKKTIIEIIAEKVTFLSSKKSDEGTDL